MRSQYFLQAVGLFIVIGACASSPPPAQESPPASSASESESAPPADSSAGSGLEAPDSDKAAEPSTSEGPKPTRSPKDVLTGPDVVFMFSFASSDASKEAEAKCDKSSNGDAKKRSECLSKEREKLSADGVRFAKDDKGDWWYITFKRKGDKLQILHKVPFEFGEEKGNTIVLKTTGKDKGPKPMNVPAKIEFEIPNDYEIATKDPTLGRVVYEAKIGIAGEAPAGK
jgi:hypothetical protein